MKKIGIDVEVKKFGRGIEYDKYDAIYVPNGPPTLQIGFFNDSHLKKMVNRVGGMIEQPYPGAHTIVAPNMKYFNNNGNIGTPKSVYYQNAKFYYARVCIDLNLFFPIKRAYTNKDLIVGWAGATVNWRKRFFIVQALDSLPGVTIVCADAHPINKPGIPNDHLRYYYSMVDCVVQTSHSEGTGAMVLEAAACGRAVVAFNVGTISELAEGGGVLIVEEHKDPEVNIRKMQEAVSSLAKDRSKVEEMGRRNADFMQNKWNQFDEWKKIFQGVTS